MQIDQNAVATVVIFIAAQTGALVFFAGMVTVTLRNYGERITKTEERSERTELTLTKLASREGIDL